MVVLFIVAMTHLFLFLLVNVFALFFYFTTHHVCQNTVVIFFLFFLFVSVTCFSPCFCECFLVLYDMTHLSKHCSGVVVFFCVFLICDLPFLSFFVSEFSLQHDICFPYNMTFVKTLWWWWGFWIFICDLSFLFFCECVFLTT